MHGQTVKWYWETITGFLTAGSLCHVAQRQNVVVISNEVQSIQKIIICQLVQEPSAGTVPSVRYLKWNNVWQIYGSLHYKNSGPHGGGALSWKCICYNVWSNLM